MNVNGSIIDCRQAPPSSRPECVLGIWASANPAASFQAWCRKQWEHRGNYWSLNQTIEDQLRSPTYLRAPQTQTECLSGAWFVSMLGTWGLILSKKINHTVLQNSYFDVSLVLVALSDSCQFVYTKELGKNMQHERRGHVSFRNHQTKLNIFRSQAQFC